MYIYKNILLKKININVHKKYTNIQHTQTRPIVQIAFWFIASTVFNMWSRYAIFSQNTVRNDHKKTCPNPLHTHTLNRIQAPIVITLTTTVQLTPLALTPSGDIPEILLWHQRPQKPLLWVMCRNCSRTNLR